MLLLVTGITSPLKTPRHFSDSILSTGGKTMLLMSQDPPLSEPQGGVRRFEAPNVWLPICQMLAKEEGSRLGGCATQ